MASWSPLASPHALLRSRSWRVVPWLAGLVSLSACVTSTDDSLHGVGDQGDVTAHPTATTAPTTVPTSPTDLPCATPEQGCTCATEGAAVDCAETLIKTPTYVSCAHGTRHCDGGVWGACVMPDDPPVTQQSLPTLGTEGLGSSTKCTNNPCDPYCSQVTDSATGLDAGADSGLTVDGGALTLSGQPPPNVVACTGLTVTPATATVSVVPGPPTYATGSLLGEYFNQYNPIGINSAWTPTATRNDATINFDWTTNGTGFASVAKTNYTVRWTGAVYAPTTGTYTFRTTSDDGVRLWVNDVLVIDKWIGQGSTAYETPALSLTAGRASSIRLDYQQQTGTALVKLEWKLGSGAYAVVPSTALARMTSPGSLVYSPSSVAHTAQLSPAGCFGASSVSPAWTVDKPDQATIDASGTTAVFSPLPGTIKVNAYVGSFVGQATVNVVTSVVDDTQAPLGVVVGSFTKALLPDSITMLYPYDQTVLPLGLLPPLIQWDNKGVPATAVKLTLRYPADGSVFSWSIIRPEIQILPTPTLFGQPRMQIPADVWRAFEQTARGKDATISIQRLVAGIPLLETPPTTIHFADGELRGSVYYNSYGTNLAANYCCNKGTSVKFGGATLGVRPGASQPTLIAGDDSKCVVCHSVSANGSRLLTQDGDNYSKTLAYDLSSTSSTAMSPTDGRFTMGGVSPDGTYIFSNSGPLSGASTAYSAMFSVPGGTAITTTGLPSIQALTPSFSPDSTHIAFNFYGGSGKTSANVTITGDQKSLGAIDYNPTTKAFSNLRVLATPGAGGVGTGRIYYPAYLPDNSGVIYELETTSNGRDLAGTRSQCDGSGTCNNVGALGELWWNESASRTSRRLDKLNGLGYVPTHPGVASNATSDAQLNYEPTVLPQNTGGYAWVVFTTRRAYGNVATINPFWSDSRYQDISVQPTPKKLWVAAIDLNAKAGTDPSHPAFYLPGQELLAGNSRGYWVLDPCIPVGTSASSLCSTTEQCCGASGGTAVCRLDTPVDPGNVTRHCTAVTAAGSCGPAGSGCATDSDCCSGTYCSKGTCAVPPPATLYAPSNYVRSPDFDGAVCPQGTHVVWRYVQWKTRTPLDSSIEFYAQTSEDASSFATLPVAPTTVTATGVVPAGVAKGADTTDWTSDGKLLSDRFTALGIVSKRYLRVTARFVPSTGLLKPPSLSDWRVTYSCVPSE